VNLLVALVVTAVAAAAFVFSYDGLHAFALLGGMSVQLARYYPGLFDAVVVVACVAAVMLRDGRWWARLWAWLVLIVVLGAIGAADVAHAVHYTLPYRRTEGIVAAAPVAAVLLAFSLLLTMLRQTRARPGTVAPAVTEAVPALPAPPLPIALPAAPAAEPDPDPAVTTAPAVLPAPPAAAQRSPYPPTEPTAVIAAAAPSTAEAPAPAPAPAPATVPVPVRESRSIRYAGNTPPQRAWELPSDRSAKPRAEQAAAVEQTTATPEDYWDSEEAGPFAGLVYSARDEGSGSGRAAGETAKPDPHPELDEDAPPFATAPFASVPRLNRQRSTPAPPTDDEDEDKNEDQND
jgi:Protein of unknown function (DUF2637)